VASKVAADLKLMQRFYGQPSDSAIDAYVTELVELLIVSGLDKVTYGFKRDDDWVVALRYSASMDGSLNADDRAGRVTPGLEITAASWYSFLEYSWQWQALSKDERARVQERIPFNRTPGTEPSSTNGYWVGDKTYSADGGGVRRATFRPL
jgi:hypothetical protein